MTSINIPSNNLLSVVVPVYNTAQYLRNCVESIIHQQYKNLEVVLINDGSSDESGELCDSFLHLDDRIRVFHRKNQGLVSARKLGVELAQGDLITFVDSDDWIDSDMYSQMMAAYMDFVPDLVTSGLTIEKDNKVYYEIDKIPEGLYELEDIKKKLIPRMMYDELTGKRAITSSVCNKIYKVNLLKEIISDLEDSITYGEDAAITYLYTARASKIAVLNNSWYHYIIHSNSMVRHYDINSFERVYQFYNYLKKKFLELGFWNHMESQLKEYTKVFLFQATQDVFDIFVEEPIYLFPFEHIEKGSRVVIYGAGKVGISYNESLLKSGYARLQGWVDKNYETLTTKKHIIEPPDILKNRETDYIVIAIENKGVASEIQEFLGKLGVKKNKIIWQSPVRLN